MEPYNHNTQSGDLTGAIDRAKKNRAKRPGAGKIAIAATIGIGIAVGGISFATRDAEPELEYAAVQQRYVPGEMLVKFDRELEVSLQADGNVVTGIDEIDALNDEISGEMYEQLADHPGEEEVDMIYLVTVSKHADMEQIAEEFATAEGVEWAIPNYIDTLPYEEVKMDPSLLEQQVTLTEPNDPLYWSEGEYKRGLRDQWPLQNIDAAEAWDITTGSPEIRVAVIDTGANYNHEDLADNILRDEEGNIIGYDFIHKDADPLDDHGHGTHVSGTIAATTNNEIGMAGMNWEAKIMPIKVCTAGGRCPRDAILAGIIFAADNDAHVINMSLGGPGSPDVYDAAIRYADEHGTIVVAAAGNSNADTARFTPANHPFVIAVAATDQNDKKASFSNWGETVDVAAPGTPILSLRAKGGYVMMQGTSMASPHTAGIVSMIIAANQELAGNREEILRIVRAAVDPYDSKKYIGTGRINLADAVRLAQETAVPPHMERIVYLMEKMPEGDIIELEHEPYFNTAGPINLGNEDGFGALVMRETPTLIHLVANVDEMPTDGTTDWLLAAIVTQHGPRLCELTPSNIPDELLKKINEQYERTTEAGYRHFEEGLNSFEGVLGEDEWNEITEVCEGRWESADQDFDLQDIMQVVEEH